MAITPNTTFTAGNVLTAAQMNRLPWGVMGAASKTADQFTITAVADVTSLSVTFTANSTRIYRTTVQFLVNQQSNAGLVTARLTDGSNVQKQQWFQNIAVNEYSVAQIHLYETGLSGSITRKVRAETSAGSVSVLAAATYPGVIIVEDIGQA